MLRTRIIPCLLLKNESLVKTIKFKEYNYIGDPVNTVRIFNELEVDELMFLDIFASKEDRNINFKILQDIANECFMPLSYGGNIKSLDEIMLNKELVCPILVKIDVQGYELEVLKGGNDFFKKIKYLIIEVSENEIYSGQSVSKEIIQYLENKNFIILKENLSTQIVNTHYMQRDILFVNKLI